MKTSILLTKNYKKARKPRKPIEPVFCKFYLIQKKITKEKALVFVGSTKDDGKVYYFKTDGTVGMGSLLYLLKKFDVIKEVTKDCALTCLL